MPVRPPKSNRKKATVTQKYLVSKTHSAVWSHLQACPPEMSEMSSRRFRLCAVLAYSASGECLERLNNKNLTLLEVSTCALALVPGV